MALDPNRLLENLGGDIRNIGASFLAGQNNALAQAQARQSLAINDFRLQQAQHQEQRDQQFQTDLNAYYQNPTLDGLARLAARYPEQAEALKQTYQVMDQQQRQSRVLQFGSLMNAAANGRVDLVKRQVQSIRDAEAAKGMDTSEADDLLNRLNNGDTTALNQVKGFAQLHLAAIDPAKFPLPGANVEGKVVGNSIGHYEGNQWVVDYQAPERPQYRTINTVDAQGNPITAIVPITTEGGGPASGGAGAYSGNAPRSVRNNNPGNLKASPFTKSLPGYQGRDKDGFAIFDSPQSGASAQAALLGNYMDRGYNTVAKIISRWAPKSDGNDTAAYVKTVARQLGVSPNDALSKDVIPRLQSAIARVESGPNNPSNGTPSGVPGAAFTAPRPAYRQLTNEEISQRGLDPNVQYQIAPDGQITPIGGQRTVQTKQIPVGVQKQIQPQIDARDSLERTLRTFRDDYAGNTWTGGLENTLQALLGTGTPGQRDWWADFQSTDNLIRNSLFGSALTEHEKRAYESTTIAPSMKPSEVRKNLQRRVAILKAATARQAKFLKANHYDPDAVDQLFSPLDLSGANASAAPSGFRILRVRPAQ